MIPKKITIKLMPLICVLLHDFFFLFNKKDENSAYFNVITCHLYIAGLNILMLTKASKPHKFLLHQHLEHRVIVP